MATITALFARSTNGFLGRTAVTTVLHRRKIQIKNFLRRLNKSKSMKSTLATMFILQLCLPNQTALTFTPYLRVHKQYSISCQSLSLLQLPPMAVLVVLSLLRLFLLRAKIKRCNFVQFTFIHFFWFCLFFFLSLLRWKKFFFQSNSNNKAFHY